MYSHTEHQRNEMPLLHFWQRSNAVSEFSWFSLDDVCCIVSLYICKNIEQEISQIWQMGGLCLLVLCFCATPSAGFWFQFLYLIPSMKSCVWPCIWRALWKFHFGVSAFVKVSGLWGLLRDCVQPHNWWGVWVAMIMLWASWGAKKQNLFIARCLDLWKLVHLWVLLDAFWSKRSQNSEVISIVEHPYLSSCFCRQKLWNIWLQILKQYKTVLAREESCRSCVRQVSTFFSNRLFGFFHFLFCKNLAGSGKIPSFKNASFTTGSYFNSVACAIGPSVTTSSTEFSFQNLVFWNLFEFSATEIT